MTSDQTGDISWAKDVVFVSVYTPCHRSSSSCMFPA